MIAGIDVCTSNTAAAAMAIAVMLGGLGVQRHAFVLSLEPASCLPVRGGGSGLLRAQRVTRTQLLRKAGHSAVFGSSANQFGDLRES